jgi:serine/threonine protein kinase
MAAQTSGETSTGMKPTLGLTFEGENVFAVMNQHVMQDPPSILQCNPKLPPELATVVMRAIRRNPAKRYAHIEDMMHDLQHLDQLPPSPTHPKPQRPMVATGKPSY